MRTVIRLGRSQKFIKIKFYRPTHICGAESIVLVGMALLLLIQSFKCIYETEYKSTTVRVAHLEVENKSRPIINAVSVLGRH